MNATTSPPPRAAGRLPLRPPFFYGWLVVGVAMVAGFLAAGSSQVFFGVMSRPISDELGWGRTATAGAVTAGTFLGAALTPVAGRLADRHGPRLLMSVGALVVAAGFFGLANVQELWQFYLAYLVTRGVSTLALTGVVPMTAVANWFSRRRGRAAGMITMAFPVANSILASGAQQVMLRGSWRSVFVGVGAAMALSVTPAAAVIMRRQPEDVGL
ncbi:MAG: MFS transporter, partial [Chloroflexota bacterium]